MRSRGSHSSDHGCRPRSTRGASARARSAAHKSIGKPPYLSPRVDPWVFLVIPRTYFRANIPDDEGGFVLAYNLMMFAVVAVCLAAIHLALDESKEGR